MLSESLVGTDNSESQPGKAKVMDTDMNRFFIRIPRSAAASPQVSIDIKNEPSNVRKVNTNESMLAIQAFISSDGSHWLQEAPVVKEVSIGKSPDSLGPQEIDNVKLSKQCDVQGTPERLPEKEGEHGGAVAIEYGPQKERKRKYVETRILGCTEYEPFKPIHRHRDFLPGAEIDVRIPKSSFDKNPAVCRRSLWGGNDGVYTDDSDAVCIIMQSGRDVPNGCLYVKASFRVLFRLKEYQSVNQNGLTSRSWKGHTGYSIKLIRIKPCEPSARMKRHQPREWEFCSIRFSSLSKSPIFEFSELLFMPDSAKVRLKLRSGWLHLIGHAHRYTLGCTNDHFNLRRDEMMLFTDLEWNEIGWVEGGLYIRNTFFNLFGYHW